MNSKFKIQQGFRYIYAIGLLFLFAILSLFKMVELLSSGHVFSWESLLLISVLFLIGYVIYLIRISKLKLKIGNKNISIKIEPFGWTRMKFSKKEVKSFKFFSSDPLTITSGHFVHFGSGNKVFNFGDSCGVSLELNSGKRVIIFSNEICENQDEVTRILSGN